MYDSLLDELEDDVVSNPQEVEELTEKVVDAEEADAELLVDETDAARGAIQTVRELPGTSLEGSLSDSGQVNEAFVSPVYKVNPHGRISSWNRGCEETFGYPSNEMIGRKAADLVSARGCS